ncbi:site-specific integrase [Nocardia cyriacigeorgica]|uniref:tyrosine-type recombinase/integrase n=1 Tax=Nocardia cyriacigeorgica TaxID=135487 RepID=UPI001895FCF8|nr:site-specific integrase [Nocardia cyriacigeorgica]MBF6081192.1 site-specific integrase [Nocardia cyriacigeorgica]MBF6094580.1 site-specific integrase [Nocardia cyriacigeorgica]MBF6158829.1 site-specific integrase [Nocardia cyriacigeorgica]MBF6197485.1 site-specific integrase [Nocardia cyriacigeorgica]
MSSAESLDEVGMVTRQKPVSPLRALKPYDTWHLKEKDENGRKIRSASYGRNRQWRGAYQDGIRHAPHTRGFDTSREAETWAQEQVAAIKSGRHITKEASRVMMSQWCWEWLELQAIDRGTYNGYRSKIRLILQYLDMYAVSEVREPHVLKLMTGLHRTGYTYDYRVDTHRLLTRIMAAAKRAELTVVMPCSTQTYAKPNRERPKIPTYCPTMMEFWTFFHEMPEETRIVVALGVGLGLRLSEALGADISDMNFETRTYRPGTQYKSKRRVGGTTVGSHDGPLKTEASGMEFPVDPWVADWIEGMLDGRTSGKFLTFSASRSGGRMSQKAMRNRVAAAVSAVGGPAAELVPWGPDGKMRQRMGFHSLRHLYGSLLADGAYSLADVTRRMRHKNNTTTLDVYTHLVDGQRSEALTLGEALLRGLREYRRAQNGLHVVGES